MKHDIARGGRLSGLVGLLSVAGVVSLSGQDPREAAVTRAMNEFDASRRVQLLTSALNPAVGPPTGAWATAVQLLAQTLIEDGKDSLAAAWLRWAVRQSPTLQPDTLQFLPRVVAAVRSARAFVTQTTSPADSGAPTTWQWPAPDTDASMGAVRVVASGPAPLQVEVRGFGPIGLGASIPLSPGSYELSASATGYTGLRATREVLPGVTTVLEFRLRPVVAQVPPRPPPPALAAERRKKKFPVVLALLGVAGAAGAAVLLGGGGKDEPTTGGITLTFPNP